MRKVNIFGLLFLSVMAVTCRDKFEPDLVSTTKSYLVVEGVLNAGSGSTYIQLSRSTTLDSRAQIVPEPNAAVTVEGRDNSVRPLSWNGNGLYVSAGLNLTINSDYRLRIKTTDGREYLSAYVTARTTPPIDSIGFHTNEKGMQIYVNTHDPANKTWYYRYEYDETWEINSYYYSHYIYIKATNTVRERVPGEEVFQCWKYGRSTGIVIASSAKLQSDVIHEAPVAFIDRNAERLSVRYSILLRQYALDKDGYHFYEQMKKNTESMGTVFDPQPSQVWGNISCVSDPTELVIGYITACTVEEKRKFIVSSEVPDWRYYQDCPTVNIKNHPDSIKEFGYGQYLPYTALLSPAGDITYYGSSSTICVDCTERGGSLMKPSYW